MVTATEEQLARIGQVLKDKNKPLKQRFRALFTLKNLGGVKYIGDAFDDPSELLKHELAYCLGQTQKSEALPILLRVLEDINEAPIARHEAGEALGAIASPQAMSALQKYANDANPVIAETSQLALKRMEFIKTDEYTSLDLTDVPYKSVDPAPPFLKGSRSVEELQGILSNPKQPLWDRYRAMFSLRNLGTPEAVVALGESLNCPSSALFRHEIAYVFGQMQNEGSVSYLSKCLEDTHELPMVRHECAEALGSIASEECTVILQKFLQDPEDVVRESCEVALDMCEYENSQELQYADALEEPEEDGHLKCRNTVYPRSDVKRAHVPDSQVRWSTEFTDYKPVFYESKVLENKPWSDVKYDSDTFSPKYNDLDGKINRKSHMGEYKVVKKLPQNPRGRTGVSGRGVLGRYGPNHAADAVVTRWSRDNKGKQVFDKVTLLPVAEFVVIRRRDNGEWAIPGGMVDQGEKVYTAAVREFIEEAVNSKTDDELKKFFDSSAQEIYKGYVDDPRNTDNAWMETVVFNFHDEKGDKACKITLEAGSDANQAKWKIVSAELELYAQHKHFVQQVAQKLGAHW